MTLVLFSWFDNSNDYLILNLFLVGEGREIAFLRYQLYEKKNAIPSWLQLVAAVTIGHSDLRESALAAQTQKHDIVFLFTPLRVRFVFVNGLRVSYCIRTLIVPRSLHFLDYGLFLHFMLFISLVARPVCLGGQCPSYFRAFACWCLTTECKQV